ncbi:hypothetical protein GCM10008107_28740 [Psychrosphaera saromensis]|uniref:ABM domain-containing protein n=1 Tax=Psychrosphaera saromensis TaxID=716813 RepID=A0A2S7UUM5_9GAMM|nr:hypothetical protein [Psychrosphaera saromensis]PQJ52981.1 hypothetical protein BTO11_04460 [Psychrosphaera saromensis]GHB77448.1 hypothetical protein GCM10008107_28740 [Psychrosphaera saromensis]GLQ12859.1 hypothetical protein GCM10007917_03140 [Psychrosphaera saromensis]
MKSINKLILSLAMLTSPIFAFAEVIEVASFNLNKDVTYQEFSVIDKTVEKEHVSKQPGFISRETAKGEKGEWLVVVHWETLKDADASMNSFMQAKAASTFMSKIDTSSMIMKRYTK